MRVLFITGSARSGSITTQLCNIVASAMPDATVTIIRPHEMRIEHCKGCGSCTSSGKCAICDDMQMIYDAVENNDIIILATPIYFSGPSSILKQTVDRFQSVWVRNKENKKDKIASLIAAGGQPSPVFSNTISIAKAFAVTVRAEWIDGITVRDTDGMNVIPENIVKEAQDLGSRISGMYIKKVQRQIP